MKYILTILLLASVCLAQTPEYPVCQPGYTILAEGDTAWIGEEGYIETDSSAFDAYAWWYWYPKFSAYSDSYAFTVVQDLVTLVEFKNNTRPTCTDLNDYPRYVCMKLAEGYKVRVNWKEFNLYNQE